MVPAIAGMIHHNLGRHGLLLRVPPWITSSKLGVSLVVPDVVERMRPAPFMSFRAEPTDRRQSKQSKLRIAILTVTGGIFRERAAAGPRLYRQPASKTPELRRTKPGAFLDWTGQPQRPSYSPLIRFAAKSYQSID